MYAMILLVLIAVMGLAIDVGYVYVSYARLRRAVDAAALDAAKQIKDGYREGDLEKAAEQFLSLNNVVDPHAEIHYCNPAHPAYHRQEMCTDPPRKLVEVTASSQVPTFFMSVLGFKSVPISASAEAEAAVVDVVLVIDVSLSQVYDVLSPPYNKGAGDALADPYYCNRITAYDMSMPGGCLPFDNVKTAAMAFVENGVYLEYDRVGIISYSRFATRTLGLTSDETEIKNAIKGLGVEELTECPFYGTSPTVDIMEPAVDDGSYPLTKGTCRFYLSPAGDPRSTTEAAWDANYWGAICPAQRLYDHYKNFDQAKADRDFLPFIPHCRNTNSGAGLLEANQMLWDTFRDDATWVVIFLTDGAANIGYQNTRQEPVDTALLSPYYCPVNMITSPFCTDRDPSNRRSAFDPTTDMTQYDAYDYSLDAMDSLFDSQVYLFTIGQGRNVDDDISKAVVNYAKNHPSGNGAAYFGSSPEQLRQIFLAIANRIATRITQ